jgi:hypothetical protein
MLATLVCLCVCYVWLAPFYIIVVPLLYYMYMYLLSFSLHFFSLSRLSPPPLYNHPILCFMVSTCEQQTLLDNERVYIRKL